MAEFELLESLSDNSLSGNTSGLFLDRYLRILWPNFLLLIVERRAATKTSNWPSCS